MSKTRVMLNILSESERKDIANYIRNQYKEKFKRKCQMFVDRLAEIGAGEVSRTVSYIPDDIKGSIGISVQKNGGLYEISILMSGEKVLFVEYGAGINYGTEPGSFPALPTGTSYGDGMGVGTYPGQIHAREPGGWYYRDETGNLVHSKGNPAYMPMYYGELEIIKNIKQIAKEVFGGS